jgi:hypothetical protein
VPKLAVVLFTCTAACSSSTATTTDSGGSVAPAPVPAAEELTRATTHDWLPSDGDRVIADFVRQCFVESSWAEDFNGKHGRQPVVRVGEVKAEVEDVVVLKEALGGQLEKALLDSKKVQVAASFQDLAELQELQSARLLGGQPVEAASGSDLSSDHILTVRVTSVAEPVDDGVVRVYTASFRVVDTQTGGMACVAMGKSKKLVVPREE